MPMKTLIFWIFLIPFLALSQNNSEEADTNSAEYLVVNTAYITPKADAIAEFKEGIKNHNQQFHSEGGLGVRIYNVLNGVNSHKMVGVMGPFHWSELDNISADTWSAHQEDWAKNVEPYMEVETNESFWRFHDELSNFPPNFDINKLQIVTYDITRMEGERMNDALKKVTDVMKEKYADLPFGVYTNELSSTTEGRDMAIAYFFDDFKWLAEDPKFKEKYEEMNGAGSFDSLLADWKEITQGSQTEIWIFNPALSGIGSQVTTGQRIRKD